MEKQHFEIAEDVIRAMPGGIFLTVAGEEEINTMTIGWGAIGIMWGKPIFTAMVRLSRHTYKLLAESGEFTVSIPAPGELKQELAICGSKSGRDIDKFAVCNLTAVPGREVNTPVIGECKYHFECKTVYSQIMEPGTLDESIKARYYSEHDYHVYFQGEIVACYEK